MILIAQRKKVDHIEYNTLRKVVKMLNESVLSTCVDLFVLALFYK